MFTGKNLVPLILVTLIFFSALFSSLCVYLYIKGTGELRGLQAQAARIENSRNLLRALAGESVEYSKRNPAINPLLQSVGLNPGVATPKATK